MTDYVQYLQYLDEEEVISAFVPDIEGVSHEEALQLASEADTHAREELIDSYETTLELERAASIAKASVTVNSPKVERLLTELGY